MKIKFKKRLGVIVVDMLERKFPPPFESLQLSHFHGRVEEGIQKLGDILSLAVKHGIPIIFIETQDPYRSLIRYGTISKFNSITDGYPGVLRYEKVALDVFYGGAQYDNKTGVKVERSFQDLLSELEIGPAIVGGYNMVACAALATKGLIARGHGVITSPDILFSTPNQDYSSSLIRTALDYYKSQTLWLDVDGIKTLMVEQVKVDLCPSYGIRATM